MQNLQCYSIVKKREEEMMFIHIVHAFPVDFEQI